VNEDEQGAAAYRRDDGWTPRGEAGQRTLAEATAAALGHEIVEEDDMTPQDRPCDDGHFLPKDEADKRYGTCTKCGWFVDQWADQEEEGP